MNTYKLKYLVFLFLLNMFSCTGERNKESKNLGNEKKYEANIDSLILKTNYGAIYFTEDTNTKSHNFFYPKDLDSSFFNSYEVKSIKKNIVANVKSFDIPISGSYWSSLYRFNDRFCLYSPSDWMNVSTIYITDSIIYDLVSDITLEIIINYKQEDSNCFTIKSLDYNNDTITTSITIINKEKGIAYWETKASNSTKAGKCFKVNSKKVKLYPIVIEDCGEIKCAFNDIIIFDSVDYQKILEKKL